MSAIGDCDESPTATGSRYARSLAVLAGLVFVAAACGGGSSKGSTTPATGNDGPGTSQNGATEQTVPASGGSDAAIQYYLGFGAGAVVVGAKAFWADESALPRSALPDLARGAKQGPDGPIDFFNGADAVAWKAIGGNRVWGLKGGTTDRTVVSGDEAALLAGESPDISVALPAVYSNKYFAKTVGTVAIAADENDAWVVLETPEAINGAQTLAPNVPSQRLWKIDATNGSKLGEVPIDDPLVTETLEQFGVAVGADAVFVSTSHGVFAVDKKTLKVTHTASTADYAPHDNWRPSRIYVADDKVVVQHSVGGPFDENQRLGIAVLDAATLKVMTLATISIPDATGILASGRSEYVDGRLYLPGHGVFVADLTANDKAITPHVVITTDDLVAAHNRAGEGNRITTALAGADLEEVQRDGNTLVASGGGLVISDLTKLP